MRDCKLWLGLPKIRGDRPRTVSSQVLQNIIKKEMRGAPYSRLKILLRGEYEKRYEVLTDGEN